MSKAFRENYPQYSLPLLETKDSKFISGTNAILLYLAGEENLTDRIAKVITL